MNCTLPKCFKTTTNRCINPNPWTTFLQLSKGKRYSKLDRKARYEEWKQQFSKLRETNRHEYNCVMCKASNNCNPTSGVDPAQPIVQRAERAVNDWVSSELDIPSPQEWPKQADSAGFVSFVRSRFAAFFVDLENTPTLNRCINSRDEQNFLKATLFQSFIAHFVHPSSSIRRLLIAATVGAGKTYLVGSILCNFVYSKTPPASTFVITQTKALKEQMVYSLGKDIRCSGVQAAGNVNAWLTKHRIQLLTYRQAVNTYAKSRHAFRNAVLILDEAHTLVDQSALFANQHAAVKRLYTILASDDSEYRILVGLTGSPLGQSWEQFLKLHNLFANPQDRWTPAAFKEAFLAELATSPEEIRQLERCRGPQKNAEPLARYQWSSTVDMANVQRLARCIAPYMVFYEAFLDRGMFARREFQTVFVTSPPFFKRSNLDKAGKERKDLRRTRLVAMDDMRSTTNIVKGLNSIQKLTEHAPVLATLVEKLRERKGKAVVFTDVSDGYGAKVVFAVLERFLADSKITLLTSDASVSQRANIINTFNESNGNPILVLGSRYSTGIDLKGAVAEMHILNVLPNHALETQAKGRVHRACSHARYSDLNEWVVRYYQYHLPNQGDTKKAVSCDDVLSAYRKASDSVLSTLEHILRQASLNGKRITSESST